MEMAHTLLTDFFIDVFRLFIGRRGEPKVVYSDNGTNFEGAERVLREELQRFNAHSIHSQLRQQGIAWHFNTPTANHIGAGSESDSYDPYGKSCQSFYRNRLSPTKDVNGRSGGHPQFFPFCPTVIFDPEGDEPLTLN